MAGRRFCLASVMALAAWTTVLTFGAVCGAPSKPASVAITPSKAQEFLAKLNRPKRYIWNRSQSDVQQWIQQFMYMGFDEKRLEVDLAYWWDQARGTDQGRQHHFDEDAPWDPNAHRHSANVNYDDDY